MILHQHYYRIVLAFIFKVELFGYNVKGGGESGDNLVGARSGAKWGTWSKKMGKSNPQDAMFNSSNKPAFISSGTAFCQFFAYPLTSDQPVHLRRAKSRMPMVNVGKKIKTGLSGLGMTPQLCYHLPISKKKAWADDNKPTLR